MQDNVQPQNSHFTKNSIDALPPLKELLIAHDLWAKKSLGQNFLLNPEITDRIAKSARVQDAYVLEVGPGPGGLTRSLLRQGAKGVLAIEHDYRCINLLQSLVHAAKGALCVQENDALTLSMQDVQIYMQSHFTHFAPDQKIHVVANLPYNIATVLLIQWLKDTRMIQSMSLMFQKEVAERICATPSDAAYGRLSILSQYVCTAHITQVLPPAAFVPAPKVYSAVVRLTPKDLNAHEKALIPFVEQVAAAAFNQRRKMLKVSLKDILGQTCSQILESLDIAPTLRPETLPLSDFVKVAKYLASHS